jgi:hypothetical protein
MDLELALGNLRKHIDLERSGYYNPKSDLSGLAAREAQ